MKPEQKFLKSLELKGRDVLEVGCGAGEASFFIIDEGAKLTAVDSDAEAISLAKRNNSSANFLVADGHQLPFESGVFDTVIFSKSLHHHKNPAGALEEASRVLRQDGTIVIIELKRGTEYQKALKPVHDEDLVLKMAGRAVEEFEGSKLVALNLDSPKEFQNINDFLKMASGRFGQNDNKVLTANLRDIIGSRISESPFFLQAGLNVYVIKPNSKG